MVDFLNGYRVFLSVVNDRSALMQNLVDSVPTEEQEQDVFILADDLIAAVAGLDSPSSEAQNEFEQVRVTADEMESTAIQNFVAFADVALLNAVRAERFLPARNVSMRETVQGIIRSRLNANGTLPFI
jgi:hypothetical protein